MQRKALNRKKEGFKHRLKSKYKAYMSLWDCLSGTKLFLFYALHYTLLFAILWFFMFAPFRQGEKTYIWSPDGSSSYLPQLIYLSQTIRDGIQSLLSGDGWTFPMYDFRLGIAKPWLSAEFLQLLAVFYPWNRLDTFYDFLDMFRFYLSGLSFSLYGFYFRQKPMAILSGTITYVFCGYTLYWGIRHSGFMMPFIMLPLLLLGAEKVLRQEKPWLFVITVCASMLMSIYFSAMFAVLILLYSIFRYLDLYRGKIKGSLRSMGALFTYGALGIVLSGVVFVPSLLINFGSGRMGRSAFLADGIREYFLYDKNYYLRFLGKFMVEPSSNGWNALGFSVLTVPAIAYLYADRTKEFRSLRRLFALLTALLCFPLWNYMLSGFNNTDFRWSFGYSFCVAVVLMVMLPKLEKSGSRDFALACFLCTLYFAFCFFGAAKEGNVNLRAFLLLGVSLILIALVHKLGWKRILPLCLAITCLSTYYSSYILYDSTQKNYIAEFTSRGKAYGEYDTSIFGSLAKSSAVQDSDGFYRVSGSGLNFHSINLPFYWGLNSLAAYTSYKYSPYLDWVYELECGNRSFGNISYGPDSRAAPLSFSGVKYYAAREGTLMTMPYGFTEVDRIRYSGNGNSDVILENQFVLPVGYTYSHYMLREEYDALSAAEKSEEQLKAVVLDTAPDSTAIQPHEAAPLCTELDYYVSEMNGVSYSDGVLYVNEENAEVTLTFESLPNSEVYLRFHNLDLTNGAEEQSWHVAVRTEFGRMIALFSSDAVLYGSPLKSQILNLGFHEEPITSCTITFPVKGTCRLDGLELWSQPMDHYAEQIEALRAEPLENVETNWRGLTGTVSVSKDKMLCLAVPYDSGWTAYVDGEKVPIYQANTAWMAVELSAGDHYVEFKYWTPGLTAGIAMSAAGVCFLVCYVFIVKKKEKREKLSGPGGNRKQRET